MIKIEKKNNKITIREDGCWEGVGFIQGATTFTIEAPDTIENQRVIDGGWGERLNYLELMEVLDGAKFAEEPDFVR
ncbi:MAG: hypothetical protein J5736_03830 [Bacilli bacterium]|nr:hypothetical protein [Bacilli bacterium]